MPSVKEQAIAVFRDNGGLLRSSEARRLGIHPQTLKRMTDEGIFEKLERGIYHLKGFELQGDSDMVLVAKLVPKAVFCLVSALNFHNMTTQIPRKLYIALPQQVKEPVIQHPPLDIVWLSDAPYRAGIRQYAIGSETVRVYDKAKTVTDCFKFRNKVGEDVAIEALKDYLQQPDRDIPDLLEYAGINRVRFIVETYLKVLV
jgi:predicted transcriptional regulator of viral defense system